MVVGRKLARTLRRDYLYVTGVLPCETRVRARDEDVVHIDPSSGEVCDTGVQVAVQPAREQTRYKYSEKQVYLVDEVGARITHVSTSWTIS